MDKVITINISEEAKAVRDAMLAQDLKKYLYENGFKKTREDLKNLILQKFPDIKVRNTLEKESVDGFNVFTLSKPDYKNIILYIHGGAWVFEFFPEHAPLCDDLVDTLDAKVYAPFYPLAPKYSYEDTYKMIVDLYDELLKLNKPIFVMGDSAGGNIALGLMLILKETGRKLPDKLIPLCPCVDMSFENPEILEVEKVDPVDAMYGCKELGKMWAKDKDLKDPLLSPLYSNDLVNFPKTLLLASTNDILTPDIMKLYKKMVDNGNDITLVKGEGLWHVFPTFDIPERKQYLDILKEFCLD